MKKSTKVSIAVFVSLGIISLIIIKVIFGHPLSVFSGSQLAALWAIAAVAIYIFLPPLWAKLALRKPSTKSKGRIIGCRLVWGGLVGLIINICDFFIRVEIMNIGTQGGGGGIENFAIGFLNLGYIGLGLFVWFIALLRDRYYAGKSTVVNPPNTPNL